MAVRVRNNSFNFFLKPYAGMHILKPFHLTIMRHAVCCTRVPPFYQRRSVRILYKLQGSLRAVIMYMFQFELLKPAKIV